LYFNVLKVLLELDEFVHVVEPHGSAKHTLDDSTHKLFVPYLDLEVDKGWVLAGAR
jgi:hypothetical protein